MNNSRTQAERRATGLVRIAWSCFRASYFRPEVPYRFSFAEAFGSVLAEFGVRQGEELSFREIYRFAGCLAGMADFEALAFSRGANPILQIAPVAGRGGLFPDPRSFCWAGSVSWRGIDSHGLDSFPPTTTAPVHLHQPRSL